MGDPSINTKGNIGIPPVNWRPEPLVLLLREPCETPPPRPSSPRTATKRAAWAPPGWKKTFPWGNPKKKGRKSLSVPTFSSVFCAQRQKKCRSAVSCDRPTPFPFCPAW